MLTVSGIGTGEVKESNIASSAVTESKIAAAAVSQGKLKTTTGELSLVGTAAGTFTLPGGEYGFFPQFKTIGGTLRLGSDGAGVYELVTETGASYRSVLRVYADGGGTSYAKQRYVPACPPYDFGDGAVPLFVFALMRADGRIKSLWVAPDPPWANNGPTCIRPDFTAPDGREFRHVRRVLAEYGTPAAARAALGLAGLADRLAADPLDLLEITQAVKQADMPLLPHPFATVKPGESVVLVSPLGPLTERLLTLHKQGESINEIFHAGYLLVGNTELALKAPPGVMPVAARWK